MCIVSAILAAQAGGRGSLYACGDGTRLEPGELMAGLSSLEYAERICMEAMLGNKQSQYFLEKWLMVHAAGEAAKQGWRLERGKRRISAIAKWAAMEIIEGCKQPNHHVWEDMGINKAAYYKTWNSRMEWLRDEAMALAISAKARTHEKTG